MSKNVKLNSLSVPRGDHPVHGQKTGGPMDGHMRGKKTAYKKGVMKK